MKLTITLIFAVSLILGVTRARAGSPDTNATTEVVATGVGIDADKALRNALMNAVQQAVGLVVDVETLVKNEAIVKDQILTYSDGYVEHFDKIKEGKRDDGLYEIKIKAIVKRRQLVEKLKDSKVIASIVDGVSNNGEVVVAGESTSISVTFPVAEPNDKYGIFIRQNWSGIHAIAKKETQGFTVYFISPAPNGAKLDWMIVRDMPANNLRRSNVAIMAGNSSFSVTFPVAEPNDKYEVFIEKTWFGKHIIGKKEAQGFTVNFLKPAPDGAKLDWMIVEMK